MKHRTAAFLLFGIMTLGIHAEETSRPGFQEGSNFGKANMGKVSAGIQHFNPQKVPGFVTDNPQETAYQAGKLSETAAKAAAQSGLYQTLTQNYQNRPTDFVKKEDAWLQKGLGIEQNENPVQTLTGRYTDCKATAPVVTPQYQTLTCDEFVGGEEKTCSIGQIVEVDAKHTYQCQSTRQSEKRICQKILNIQFQENIAHAPSCTKGSVIASGKGRIISVTIFCEIDSPILTMDFVFGSHHKRAIRINSTGTLSFRHDEEHGWAATAPLAYSLSCDTKEQCRFTMAVVPNNDPPISLSFERPRTKSIVQRIPVDAWDNQCAALEGRIK